MSAATKLAIALSALGLVTALTACDKPKETAPATTTATAAAPPPPPPPGTSAKKAEPAKPRDDCPEGSAGPGTFKEPCEAKGEARIMDVKWTKKLDDSGPQFNVKNNADKTIIFGAIAVYFYDKDGKQLDVKVGDKTHKKQRCTGRIFAGVMKPGESAKLQFSCVKKTHVPEGTVTVEGEMQMVGFADESGKKTEYYWRNDDLAPEERPMGGVKKK